jgi:hypothetical protein
MPVERISKMEGKKMPERSKEYAENLRQTGDKSQQIYRPPAWGWRLVHAFLDPEVKPTVLARCEEAKVNRASYYRKLRDFQFVSWFSGLLAQGALTEAGDVRQALFKQCLLGSIEAIRLWYQVYGKFIPTDKTIFDRGGRSQGDLIDDVTKLTDEELRTIYEILERSSKADEVG